MPTKPEEIEKWSRSYYVLKLYVDQCFKFYFKNTIEGVENIPKDKPIIFAPNHQNALMDALAVLCTKTWQPVFVARADIFKKPLVNKILTFLKILPIFRIRDGYENLQKNDDVFNKTVDVINNRNGLVILPEGNHGDKKQLRPLKKGIARIALQAENSFDGELDIHIVPVGIDYTNYIKVRSGLLIRYGTPISVRTLMTLYEKNPAKAHKLLIDLVEEGLKPEMIHIEDKKYYMVYKIILDMFTKVYNRDNGIKDNHSNQFTTQKLIIAKMDKFRQGNFDDFLLLAADALEYNLLLNRRDLTSNTYPMSKSSKWSFVPLAILVLVLSPLHLYSFINNLIPISGARLLSNKFKDKQFLSSVRFAAGLVLFPIFHLIQVTAFAIITKSLIFTLAYAVSLPLSVYFFFLYKGWSTKLWAWVKKLKIAIFSPKRLTRLYELHRDLTRQMFEVIEFADEDEYMKPLAK